MVAGVAIREYEFMNRLECESRDLRRALWSVITRGLMFTLAVGFGSACGPDPGTWTPPPPPPTPGSLTCGQRPLECGCHFVGAPVFPGQRNTATACSSGVAEIVACAGSCGGGNVPFATQCTCDPDPEPDPEPQVCTEVEQRPWSGAIVCAALPPVYQFVADRLSTFWQTGPSQICNYDSRLGGFGACGPLLPNNAFYCSLDDMIASDMLFFADQAGRFGDFAPVAILAHEWGHLNQQRLGQLNGPTTKVQELHADCQAGVFAAFEEDAGNLQMGDVDEAFASLCSAGDPVAAPWFQPGAHGTCSERHEAFSHGLDTARAILDRLCTGDRLATMRAICG